MFQHRSCPLSKCGIDQNSVHLMNKSATPHNFNHPADHLTAVVRAICNSAADATWYTCLDKQVLQAHPTTHHSAIMLGTIIINIVLVTLIHQQAQHHDKEEISLAPLTNLIRPYISDKPSTVVMVYIKQLKQVQTTQTGTNTIMCKTKSV